MTDNRRATRHFVSIAAKITIDGQSTDAVMMNLSLGGALVGGVAGKHPMGRRLTVAFTVPGLQHQIEVGATVRWTDSSGLGVQFDGLRARDVWALNEFFKRLP